MAPHPRILELRIHGVLNMPPYQTLGLKADEVEETTGDGLAGFWTAKDPTVGGTTPNPPGIRREAYSWGLLARTGAQGVRTQGIAVVSAVLVRLGWFLIVPFGLTNAAYWTRRIPHQTADDRWDGGRGAPLLRLFALGMTMLLVATIATVTLDLVGVGCFRADQVCDRLPQWLDFLGSLSRAERSFLLSLVPLAAIVVLYLIGRSGRVRYQANVRQGNGKDDGNSAHTDTDPARVPVLQTWAFWSRSRVSAATEWLHFAAALLLLAFLLLWDQVFSQTEACGQLVSREVVDACTAPVRQRPVQAVLLVVVLIVGCVVCWRVLRIARGSADLVSRQVWAFALLVVGAAAYVMTGILSLGVTDDPGEKKVPERFLGLVALPAVVVIVLLVLALVAVGWRSGMPHALGVLLGGIVLVASAFAVYTRGSVWSWWGIGACLAAIALVGCGLRWRRPGGRKEERRYESWRGAAPAVVLIAAIGSAMALGTLLVTGVWSWITQPASCASCGTMWRSLGPAGSKVEPSIPVPGLPHLFAEFGLSLIVALVVVAVVFLVILGTLLLRGIVGHVEIDPAGDVDRDLIAQEPDAEPVAAAARRMAGLMHRAEPAAFGIVIAIGISLVMAVVGAALALAPGPDTSARLLLVGSLPIPIENLPTYAAIVVAAAGLGLVAGVVRSASAPADRPLGLLWDLIGFLPRAAHPFGPPCYSERAIPEIVERVRRWQSDSGGRKRGRVIVSAHSLGAVLAVASLFAMRARGIDTSRVALLTYGAQLRPYFGRFFPELFGADVLGTRPTRSPSLLTIDPWKHQVSDDLAAPVHASDVFPLWSSLWRRTDFLGFPVNSYRLGGIDRAATEWEPKPATLVVATHNNYPDTPQYDEAVAELARRLAHVR